jgi:hypothetical protein
MLTGLGAFRPRKSADQILGSLPPTGQAGKSSLGTCLLKALHVLQGVRWDQSCYSLPMPGDEDRSPLLHFADAAGKMSLGFNDRKVSGNVRLCKRPEVRKRL